MLSRLVEYIAVIVIGHNPLHPAQRFSVFGGDAVEGGTKHLVDSCFALYLACAFRVFERLELGIDGDHSFAQLVDDSGLALFGDFPGRFKR